jgi:hypothetical protein
MVRFKVLSGKMAGTEYVARRFPFRIGRSSSSDLTLEDAGVWDHHVEVIFDSTTGFVLTAQPGALASINDRPFQEETLRNGDVVGLGALKIRFWLGETRQAGLRLREGLVWAVLALITAGQIFLIYRLIP